MSMYAGEYATEPAWYPADDGEYATEPAWYPADEAAIARAYDNGRRDEQNVALPDGESFVVVWDRDESMPARVTLVDEKWISNSYDMADCGYMEGIKQILALDQNGRLTPILVGERRSINQGQEFPFHYANAPIKAGERIVGYVTFTDH